jgi:DNA-binding transcriptional MerR regulator
VSASTSAAHAPEPEDAAASEPWPPGISRRATMRISDVLRALRTEFPHVSHSKLRFLEEQGLIEPVRTPAGYRQYSPADVERLRYVLVEQRDRYLPLKVIKDRLAALDAGTETEALVPRLATADGDPDPGAGPRRYTVETLAAAGGVDRALVDGLVEAGVLRPTAGGQLDAHALDVVTLAAGLAEHGIEPRHLRTLRTAADRQVNLVQQVVAPWRSQQSASARAHADTVAAEIGELCARLHTVFVRQGVDDLTR